MKLVVGLGNPGKEYEGTRHNIGFEVLAQLSARFHAGRRQSKFRAEVSEVEIHGHKVLLICPMTFMNLSGQSVKAAVDFFKVQLNDLMLVCDDLSLDPGRIRIRASGSAGGQNGLANAIQQLGTDAFPRLRIGIGQAPGTKSAADYVLGTFSKVERAEMDLAVMRAADAVEVWVKSGIGPAMNRFNPDPAAETKQKSDLKPAAEALKPEISRAQSRKPVDSEFKTEYKENIDPSKFEN
jgi:peptidyl-tRNA hydrolase, PTH1 family